jgi:membrane protein
MAGESISRWARIRAAAQDFFEEKGIESDESFGRSGMLRFAHFWLLVFKSFVRNRCPVRAAALAYTTLLALVPLLAVGISITTSMLQREGEEPVEKLINKLVGYIAPALDLEARPDIVDNWMSTFWEDWDRSIPATNTAEDAQAAAPLPPAPVVPSTPTPLTNAIASGTNQIASSNQTAQTSGPATTSGREQVVKQITAFISNIKSGTLGFVSVVALLFVGISLLRTIEAAFNDIWGVTQARGWIKSIVYYWAAITLGPLFLVGALTLTTGSHLDNTRAWLDEIPLLGTVAFHALPFIILTFGFSAFYAVMPNTRVHFKAALVGGAIGGCLWQLNNLFNVIYVSRVVTYTNIYGSIAVIPLFLVGMYFSWLIMLFGAQVAYAYQNRRAYIQERQAESVNQRGREFIALRLMTHIAQNFLRGERPLSSVDLSRQLAVPSQLAQRILCALVESGLLVEVLDHDVRFSPGRPLERITAYDVICALRAGRGHELATTEDGSRMLVRAEFERMLLAEREAGASVSMQSLAELAARQISDPARPALTAKT